MRVQKMGGGDWPPAVTERVNVIKNTDKSRQFRNHCYKESNFYGVPLFNLIHVSPLYLVTFN
jgi:hypothetical protein